MEHTPNGLLLVDKSEGWTSHDVVAKVRRALGTRKVGHAGTLDPMATGLLVLGVGPSTRLLTHLIGLSKTYTATIRLGMSTVTDDREGALLELGSAAEIATLAAAPQRIAAAVAELTGAIEQSPSAVSAIKVAGRRAYDLVREGQTVELKKRPVKVHSFEIAEPRLAAVDGLSGGSLPFDVLDIDAVVECSAGTYIRALARDLGNSLGVGGHLTALRRSEVGPFSVAHAISNDALVDAAPGSVQLLPAAEVAARLFPVLNLTADQTADLGHGKRFEIETGQCEDAPIVAAISPDARLIGLVSLRHGCVRVVTNFPHTVDGGSA